MRSSSAVIPPGAGCRWWSVPNRVSKGSSRPGPMKHAASGDCRKMTDQIAQDLCSPSRSDGGSIAGLCDCRRDAEGGRNDQRDGVEFDRNRLGVHSAIPIAAAVRPLSPQRVCVRSDMARYARVSRQIMQAQVPRRQARLDWISPSSDSNPNQSLPAQRAQASTRVDDALIPAATDFSVCRRSL